MMAAVAKTAEVGCGLGKKMPESESPVVLQHCHRCSDEGLLVGKSFGPSSWSAWSGYSATTIRPADGSGGCIL